MEVEGKVRERKREREREREGEGGREGGREREKAGGRYDVKEFSFNVFLHFLRCPDCACHGLSRPPDRERSETEHCQSSGLEGESLHCVCVCVCVCVCMHASTGLPITTAVV